MFINHVPNKDCVIMDLEHLANLEKQSSNPEANICNERCRLISGIPDASSRPFLVPLLPLAEGVVSGFVLMGVLSCSSRHVLSTQNSHESVLWWGHCTGAWQHFGFPTCLFQQERDSCVLILIPETNTGRDVGS